MSGFHFFHFFFNSFALYFIHGISSYRECDSLGYAFDLFVHGIVFSASPSIFGHNPGSSMSFSDPWDVAYLIKF